MNVKNLMMCLAMATGMMLSSAPVIAGETDERIEAAAQSSYVFKTYLKDDDVTVRSTDGIVALTGTVKEMSHKSLAQETVATLPGVKDVDNKLVFDGEQPPQNSDAWISMKVKSVLLFNRNVSAAKTQVFVTDGIVTLKGEAANQAQKDLSAEYAKDVEGVKEVKNELTLREDAGAGEQETMGDKIDDASITAQVKIAFLIHHSTSAFKTGVATDDGVVTLSGNAANAAGKDMATKVARDIHGVTNVINNMTIIDPVLK